MNANLTSLATELVEEIVQYLDFYDIASLRLTCRILEQKASYGRFTTYFKRKNIDLTWDTLYTLAELTSYRGLATHLQHCTISGVALNHEAPVIELARNMQLLCSGFEGLVRHSAKGTLQSLALRVSPNTSDGMHYNSEDLNPLKSWRAIWKAAVETFHLTMDALTASGLKVEHELDLFSIIKGCSLGYDTFSSFVEEPAFTHLFSWLKVLSLSLSAPLQAVVEHSLEAETSAQVQTRYSTLALRGVERALSRLPELQTLDVHWYCVHRIQEVFSYEYSAAHSVRRDQTNSAPMSPHTKCIMRGFYLSEFTLDSFLSSIKAPHIQLYDIHLTVGTWSPILERIASSTTSFLFDDLFEGPSDWLIHFGPMYGRPKFPCGIPVKGPSRLSYDATLGDLPKPNLAYETPLLRLSVAFDNWKLGKRRDYGPPHSRHEFMAMNRDHGYTKLL